MTGQEIRKLLEQVGQRLAQEPGLIHLQGSEVVFVGDTHGDFEATQLVIERHPPKEATLVFLGDYVDRGPKSSENLNFLLQLKLDYPDKLFLLMGNHEGRKALRFYPADFWESLEPELHELYAETLSHLPLAAVAPNGVIALHGALPDVPELEDIGQIKLGTDQWYQITWGDWQEEEGEILEKDAFTGRPQFGQGWFEKLMARFGKQVLIRSHQPGAPQLMYGGRCLTIFTSSAYRLYVPQRTIALADLERGVKTAADLTIEVI